MVSGCRWKEASDVKITVRRAFLIPSALLLVLLPLLTYMIFNGMAGTYVNGIADNQLRELLSAVEPAIREAFSSPNTAPNSKQAVQAQARAFLTNLHQILKVSDQNAYLLVMDENRETVYPKDRSDQPYAQTLINYFTELSSPDELVSGTIQRVNLNGRNYAVAYRKLNEADRVRAKFLLAYCPVFDISVLRQNTGRLLLLSTSVFALIYLALFGFLSGHLSISLRKLGDEAIRVGHGDFTLLPVKSQLSEVRVLQTAMNQMADKLRRSQEKQKFFFQNASHELRTPLMAISGYVQGLQCGILPDRDKAIATIGAESAKLTELVNQILSLSCLDSADEPIQLEPVCVAEVLEDCLSRLEGVAISEGVLIERHVERTALVAGQPDLLQQTLDNLVSNALRYAQTRVEVTLIIQQEQAILCVSDDGPGFSPKDLEHLFERFYKGEKGKFGIGLSLAQSCVEHMGGRLRAYNRKQGAALEATLRVWP